MVRDAVIDALEACFAAQLKAVRSLRSQRDSPRGRREHAVGEVREKGRSHISAAFAILASAGSPLHVSEIIKAMDSRFGLTVDRESLVSAHSKRVLHKDRFARTAPNTFGLLELPGFPQERQAAAE